MEGLPESRTAAAILFEWADRVSGALVVSAVVLEPWLFGTTEGWSIWLLNVLGYLLGLLLGLKWLLRWRAGALAIEGIRESEDAALRSGNWVVRSMAVLTVLVLFYCLVSALNARATYNGAANRFEYHNFISWLPFSYDSKLTWGAFWSYLALSFFFWATRDWLLHPARGGGTGDPRARWAAWTGLPPRFRTLFWVVSINSTLLALEGLFQQLSGTDKLLWVRGTYLGRAEHMFGPFAFRGNAAQYFNLAWPAILGLWWAERERAGATVWEERRIGGGAHSFLLVCAIVTAAAPMIAGSQGGALINVAMLGAAAFIFLVNRRGTWQSRFTVLTVCLSVLALGGALGWDQLAPRLRETFKTPYANPNELYDNALSMARDYPLFGIGPGAFRALYPLYRSEPKQTAQAFLHDDWLETRVTFGWAGSMLVLLLLGLALARWFVPGGAFGTWEFVAMLWVAVLGILAHAKFSFPLQVYSILGLLLVHLAALSSLSRPER